MYLPSLLTVYTITYFLPKVKYWRTGSSAPRDQGKDAGVGDRRQKKRAGGGNPGPDQKRSCFWKWRTPSWWSIQWASIIILVYPFDILSIPLLSLYGIAIHARMVSTTGGLCKGTGYGTSPGPDRLWSGGWTTVGSISV